MIEQNRQAAASLGRMVREGEDIIVSNELFEKILAVTEKRKDPLVLNVEEEDRVLEYARRAVKGGLVYVNYKYDTEETAVNRAFCAMMAGIELGLTRQQALSNVAVVSGKPKLMAKMALGLCLSRVTFDKRPWKEEINFDLLGDKNRWHEAKVIWRCIRGGVEFKGEFSMADAHRAQLLGRGEGENSNWHKYPKDMLGWRALDRLLGASCADILMGAGIAEASDPTELEFPVERKSLPTPMEKLNKEDEPPWTTMPTSQQGESQKGSFPSASTAREESSTPESKEDGSSIPSGKSSTESKGGSKKRRGRPPGSSSPRESTTRSVPVKESSKTTSEENQKPVQSQLPMPPKTHQTAKEHMDNLPKTPPANSSSMAQTSTTSPGGGLPTPKKKRMSKDEQHQALADLNRQSWAKWQILAPHLPRTAMADILQKLRGAKIHPAMEKHLLEQAVARAKYHLGSTGQRLLRDLEAQQSNS